MDVLQQRGRCGDTAIFGRQMEVVLQLGKRQVVDILRPR